MNRIFENPTSSVKYHTLNSLPIMTSTTMPPNSSHLNSKIKFTISKLAMVEITPIIIIRHWIKIKIIQFGSRPSRLNQIVLNHVTWPPIVMWLRQVKFPI